ncbi:MAG: CidA/LrgA family protein [Flavobacteriales bacterium]|nr:CidA/LrgA family protein [Flavobacteriales bacterium]
MKIIGQLAIILAVYLSGLFLEHAFNLPLPGSIIGLLIMLLLLHLKVIKVEKIKQVSDFFLNNMMFFFIPATAGIMASYHILDGFLLQVILLVMISVVITISVTALLVQFIAKRKDERNG